MVSSTGAVLMTFIFYSGFVIVEVAMGSLLCLEGPFMLVVK